MRRRMISRQKRWASAVVCRAMYLVAPLTPGESMLWYARQCSARSVKKVSAYQVDPL